MARYTRSSRTLTRTPSTWITAVRGSTRRPNSVTTAPSTLTRPSAISSSAALLDPTPAFASTFCRRTPSDCSDVIDRVHLGQQRGDRRQILQRGQSDSLKEQFGGAEQESAGLAVRPGLLDQPAGQQGSDHTVHIDPADGRDPLPGNGLPVGDHREGLQGGAGQPGALAVEEQLLHERGVPVAGVEPPAATDLAEVDAALLLGVLVG